MARVEYPPEIKAQVLADLALGMSVYAVAKARGMSDSTVRAWRDQALSNGSFPTAIAGEIASTSRTESQDLGELINAFVVSSLRSLRVQVELMGDRTWLERIEPEQVIAAHRELRDGTIRILATAQRREAIEDGASAEPATD